MTIAAIPEKEKQTGPLNPVAGTFVPSWRLPGLDGLRATACLMVYMVHSWEFAEFPKLTVSIIGWNINFGHIFEPFRAGVDLFMVLSGFCLFWPICKSSDALAKWNWKEYVVRRVRRIVPPYYAAIAYALLLPQILVVGVVIVTLFAHHAWGSMTQILETFRDAHWQDPSTTWRIVSHLLFIHTLSPDAWDKITGAFWSLGLEMQFYVVFPFVLLAFRKWRLHTLTGMIVLSIIFRISSGYWFLRHPINTGGPNDLIPFLFTITFIGRWMQFAVGMLAAWIVSGHLRRQKTLSALPGNCLVMIALGLFILVDSGILYNPSVPPIYLIFPWRDFLLAISFGCLVFAVTSTRTWVRPFFEWRPITAIGFISYSIFLIHQPTSWYFSELLKKGFHIHGGPLHLLINVTLGLTITITAAYFFFLAYERPFLSTSHKTKNGQMKKVPAPDNCAAP